VHTKDCGITSQSFIVSVITLHSFEITIGGCMLEYEVLLERQIILRTSLVVEAASEMEAREKVQDMIDNDEFATVEELIALEATDWGVHESEGLHITDVREIV
jgi:hypothetical protein